MDAFVNWALVYRESLGFIIPLVVVIVWLILASINERVATGWLFTTKMGQFLSIVLLLACFFFGIVPDVTIQQVVGVVGIALFVVWFKWLKKSK